MPGLNRLITMNHANDLDPFPAVVIRVNPDPLMQDAVGSRNVRLILPVIGRDAVIAKESRISVRPPISPAPTGVFCVPSRVV